MIPNTACNRIMDRPTLRPKFLKNNNELGLIAVGFSGGQVGRSASLLRLTSAADNMTSANPESMLHPWHYSNPALLIS